MGRRLALVLLQRHVETAGGCVPLSGLDPMAIVVHLHLAHHHRRGGEGQVQVRVCPLVGDPLAHLEQRAVGQLPARVPRESSCPAMENPRTKSAKALRGFRVRDSRGSTCHRDWNAALLTGMNFIESKPHFSVIGKFSASAIQSLTMIEAHLSPTMNSKRPISIFPASTVTT